MFQGVFVNGYIKGVGAYLWKEDKYDCSYKGDFVQDEEKSVVVHESEHEDVLKLFHGWGVLETKKVFFSGFFKQG